MIKKSNSSVRWQDGSYDPYQERYREVVTRQSYWDWVESNVPQDEHGAFIESPLSNPDVLADGQTVEPVLTEELDALRVAAFEQLTPRQQEVWDLVMRQGHPQSEVAQRLEITQQAVSKLLDTAKASFTNYLREASNG